MDPDNNKVCEINTRIMLCVNQAIEGMRDDGLTDNEVLFCLQVLLSKEVPSLDFPEFRRLQNILHESNLTYYANNPASMMPAAISTDEDKKRAKEQFVNLIQGHIERIVKEASNLGDDGCSSEKHDAAVVEMPRKNCGERDAPVAPSERGASRALNIPSVHPPQPSCSVIPQPRSDVSSRGSNDSVGVRSSNASQNRKPAVSRVARFFNSITPSRLAKPPIMINCTAVHEMENDPSALLQMIALKQPVEKTFPTNDDIFVQGDVSVGSKRYRLCINDYNYPVYYSNDKIDAHLIDAQITLMIFDLTSVESFKNITKHASEVIDRYNLHAPKILFGNKKSLDDRSAVNRAEIEQVAKDIHAVYFECSPASDMQIIIEQIVRSYLTIPERYLHRSHHVEVSTQSEGSEQMWNATKISCSTVHESGAGSSSLFRQIVDRKFTHQSECTIYSGFFRRGFILDNELFDVSFVDAGAIRIYPNIDAIYKPPEVSVILLLFDLSRRETFEEIDRLAEKVKGINAATRLILIGTKSDLVDVRAVTREEAEAAATRLNIPYFECSAKDNVNLENICAQIIREYKLFVSENDRCMPQLENRPT